MPHTITLAGGGTGGHVYPALAMGDALRARGHRVLYYGEEKRLEGRVAPERGYPFRSVRAVAFPRSGLVAKLRFAWQLLGASWATRAQLRADGVTAVLGVGGYVMAPTVFAAWSLGIPAFLHESNVAPGLANRACARVARLVLLTYAETAARLPGAHTQVVGCPVNPKILAGDRVAAHTRYGLDPTRPTLLVVGGSLGAATVNELALACARRGDLQLIHVTGPRYHDEIRARYGTVPAHVALLGYEDRMGDAFAAADLVVCRSGSSTLAELCAVGKPSVLIPSPNVTDNHQEANARGLERAGAARVLLEAGLDVDGAAAEIAALLADPAALVTMGAAARSLGRPAVADEVAGILEAQLGDG